MLVKNECIDESSSFVADFGNGLVFETGDLECDMAAILKRAEGKEGTVYVRPHDVICRQTVYEDVKYTYIMSEKDFLGGYLSFQFNILLGMILLAVTGIVICIKIRVLTNKNGLSKGSPFLQFRKFLSHCWIIFCKLFYC